MDKPMLIAAAIFLATYAILVVERFNRAVVALIGAAFVIFLGVADQEAIIEEIDFNTIGLLVGMMIIIHITRKTGVFQYLAIKTAKFAKGDPWRVLVSLGFLTAFLSAFIGSVTTVILIVPITILIADELDISPYPFLVFQILASNIGGAATLVGDPPNIMIGSATGLTFMDFVMNVGPVVPVIMIFTVIPLKFIYGKALEVSEDKKRKIMEFREEEALKDIPLLKKSAFVLAMVITGFLFHGMLHLEVATIALSGAALLMLISKEDFHGTMEGVEWITIFFFVGLFGIVAGLEKTGVIALLANGLLNLTGGDMTKTAMAILWLSAIASSIVDNIPFVATTIPMIEDILPVMRGDGEVLWWALSLATCLGGNGSIIGAAANVVVAGIAERSGYRIGFVRFFLLAFPLMILSIMISTVYLYLRYLV